MEEKNENMNKVEEAKRGGSRLWSLLCLDTLRHLRAVRWTLLSFWQPHQQHCFVRQPSPLQIPQSCEGVKDRGIYTDLNTVTLWWNLNFDASERGVSLNVGFF